MKTVIGLIAIQLLTAHIAANAGQCEPMHMGSQQCPYAPEDYPSAGVSPYHILYSYRLSDSLADTFDPRDGRLSYFWDAWEQSASYDYIELNNEYPGNSWERSSDGWNGVSDAHAIVRSAWHESGLYLYFEVTDDQFVDEVVQCLGDECIPGENDFRWANDGMDFFIDNVSTDVHAVAPNLFIDGKKRITYSTVQIVYQFGADAAAPEFMMTRTQDDDTRLGRWYSFEEASAQWGGLVAETIIVHENKKIQEWRIPWREVINIQRPTPGQPGSRIAFSCGYNDADGGTNAYDALRWRNAGDPTKRVPVPEGGSHRPVEPWGDIQFVEDEIDSISPSAARHAFTPAGARSAIQSIEYYDMRGRIIEVVKPDQGATDPIQALRPQAGAIILRRIVYSDGSSRSRRIPTSELAR